MTRLVNLRGLRRLVALLFCLLLVLSPAFSQRVGMPAEAASSAYWKGEYNKYKQQYEEQKKATGSIADQLYGQQSSLLSLEKLRDLQKAEIESIEAEMVALDALVSAYSQEILEKTTQQEELRASMEKSFEIFCQRLVFMHETGEQGYLDFLFNSGDFSDLLSRGEIMNDFLKYDSELIRGLHNDYETLSTMQEEIALLKTEAETNYALYEEQSLVLQAKIEVYEQRISDYEDALAKIQREYNEAKDRESQLKDKMDYADFEYNEAYDREHTPSTGFGGGITTPGHYGAYSSKRFPCPLPSGTFVKTQPFGFGHYGVDLATYYSNPNVNIYAAEKGMVVAAGWHYSWGYYVKISHGDLDIGDNVYTLYAHMVRQPVVSVGQWVSQGQHIGNVGSSGNSTGPHLHFELYVGGAGTQYRCNPEAY